MDFSDDWRSLWPVSSVFAAPSLLSSSTADDDPVGPLVFSPSPSPPLLLLSSPSLALRSPFPLPASSFVQGMRSFFRRPENEAFLPNAAVDSLAVEASLSAPGSSPAGPFSSNRLVSIRCRNGSSMVLLFPTGPNANWIGYAGFSFRGSARPELRIDEDGEVFVLTEGFRHPYHQILKISVAAMRPDSWSPEVTSATPGNPLVEGFLIATTLYSVNWFRVETGVLDDGRERPFLIPLAHQGFQSAVMHACWSPHIVEESAALLESGELCWFNLLTKRSGTRKLALVGEHNPAEWLSCEFGGQPWTLIVASTKMVLLIDLRSTKGAGRNVLAQIEMPISLQAAPLTKMNEKFLAFCKAGYNDHHIAVTTERRLLLFDVRKPLIPVLTWNHRLESPRYISMFCLSELRPSKKFKRTSESGFAILIGSFWNNVFTLFCYGPRLSDNIGDSFLYAWGLPSNLILSDNECAPIDCFVREIFTAENFLYQSTWKQRKNIVVGFFIVPNDIFPIDSDLGEFSLVRLTLSGKLEMQKYHASSKLACKDINFKVEDQLEIDDSNIACGDHESKVSKYPRYDFITLWYLYKYMNGNLSDALASYNPENNQNESCKLSLVDDMDELTSRVLNSSELSISTLVNEVSNPTSIFEVACRRTLNCLRSDMLPLAFAKYSTLFKDGFSSNFEFLEVPLSFLNKRCLPFFVTKPSRRGEKWYRESVPQEGLVGPVLPIPVLLALQEIDEYRASVFRDDSDDDLLNKECRTVSDDDLPNNQCRTVSEDDLLNNQCKTVLKDVFPEISISNTTNCNAFDATEFSQAEKHYFVYEPAKKGTRSTCCGTSSDAAVKMNHELPRMNQMKQAFSLLKEDENFSTFLCGVADKGSDLGCKSENSSAEIFDLSPLRLDFSITQVELQPTQEKILKGLRRQFSKWQENYKPFKDFCASTII